MKKKELDKGQRDYINRFKKRFGKEPAKNWPVWIPKRSNRTLSRLEELRGLLSRSFKRKCPKCGLVLTYSQYDQIPEDDAYKALGAEEVKRCPSCKEYVSFKPMKTGLALRREIERKFDKDRSEGRAWQEVNLDVQQYLKALLAWDEGPAKEHEELIKKRYTPQELEDFRKRAKPLLDRVYRSMGLRLCALEECLELVPLGARSHRMYCSEECKNKARQRMYRRRKRRPEKKRNR